MKGGQDTVNRSPRSVSLRREWSRAFATLLGLLLAAAAVAIVGVHALVANAQGPAVQLRQESQVTAELRSAVVSHEEVGHRLLSAEPVDLGAYLREQHHITALFAAAAAVFPPDAGLRGTVLAAEQSWRSGLTGYGLWGAEVADLHGSHTAQNPTYGASSDSTVALLDGLQEPSLSVVTVGLARGRALEWDLIATLSAMFALAAAVTVYFRRRMVRDLIRPLFALHRGVAQLQTGDYSHRIRVARADELGELAVAFNDMADALHLSHQDLSLRASHDALTGLVNRASLTDRLVSSFAAGADRRTRQDSLLFIDIDDFKDVNDTLGHEGGDLLLKELSARLTAAVRPRDVVARLGGDEFAIIVAEDDNGSAAVAIAERIMAAVDVPFTINNTPLRVGVSIGVAQRGPETGDPAELLRHADFAMYMAKGGGKGRYQLFDADLNGTVVERSTLSRDLPNAVADGQLRLDYQPIADLATGLIVGVEAFVRWHHPTLGLLPPAEFIRLAEETGDIDEIGCWVLDTAARQAAAWRRAVPDCGQLWMAVNLSPFQLTNTANLLAVEHILTDPAAEAEHVVLELTESSMAADIDETTGALTTLKATGVKIAIDHFGTGANSLSMMAALPVDILKIDRTFLDAHPSRRPPLPLLQGILGMAEKLSITVVAAGIEDPEHLAQLRHLGAHTGQGFLLAQPSAAPAIHTLLSDGTPLSALDPDAEARSRGLDNPPPANEPRSRRSGSRLAGADPADRPGALSHVKTEEPL